MPWWYKWVQGVIVLGLLIFVVFVNVLVLEMNLSRVSTGFIAMVTNGIMMYGVVYWRKKSLALSYRRVLRQKGIDVCIWCGYGLQGLGSEITRCPECGKDRPPCAV